MKPPDNPNPITRPRPRQRSLAEILQSIETNARELQKNAEAVTRTLAKMGEKPAPFDCVKFVEDAAFTICGAPQKDGVTDAQNARGAEAEKRAAASDPREWK